tara:strand:+ start:3664 stop:4674 length:1011 start_codon:yes stop_codon:yes gene_type:complete
MCKLLLDKIKSLSNFSEELLENILINLSYNYSTKPLIIVGTRYDGVYELLRIIASFYLCSEQCLVNNSYCKNCSIIIDNKYPDFHLISSNNLISYNYSIKSETVEDYIIKNSYLSSVNSEGKVLAVEDANFMTKQASNALLKLFEESLTQKLFILTTSDIKKIPNTIVSRCEVYNLLNFSYSKFIDITSSNKNLDKELIDKIWFVSRGKIWLTLLLLDDTDLLIKFEVEVHEFIDFIFSPMSFKLSNSEKYLNLLKEDYLYFNYLIEISIEIIKDAILNKNINDKSNLITIYDNKNMLNLNNNILLRTIHNLSSIDFYLKSNINPSIVIDNLIFSL